MYRVIRGLLVSVFVLLFTACGGGIGADNTLPNVIVVEGQALKKTGQSKSYDVNGNKVTDGSLKDDASYQKGATPSYTRDDVTNIVIDHVTGLEWQDNAEVKTVTKVWANSQSYCNTLGLDGGGWRLPTRKELVGLSDYGRANPAINPAFTNVMPNQYWSSTTGVGYSSYAWYVDFGDGYQDDNAVNSNSFYIRCVRVGHSHSLLKNEK